MSRLLCARTTPLRLDRPRETWLVAPLTPTGNVLSISRCRLRAWHGGLSDATVTREGITLADVYYLKPIRSRERMAPATVSGYKTCLRADQPL